MKHRHTGKGRPADRRALQGPSQRQLRAGELVRHALVEVFREEEFADEALKGVSVTITQARMSPDLRHAQVFVEPLGGAHAGQVVGALNRHTRFLRGRLGRLIDMKFTPDLHFQHDATFEEAERMARLFDDPKVREDLHKPDDGSGPEGEDGQDA